MSRIRGIETKKRKRNEPDTTREKDDVEKNQIAELLTKIPQIGQKFKIHRKIGEGAFSSVYLGSPRSPEGPRRLFAIKHLVPTIHPSRVAQELKCLRDMGGMCHVIPVEFCYRHLDHVAFIMPYVPHKKFSEYVDEMDASELCKYMRMLFVALRHVHSFGVIHRDVKPSNFLYDREEKKYQLVDFGLAQQVAPPAQPPPAHQSLKRPREDDLLPSPKRMLLDLSRPRAVRPPPPAPPAPRPPYRPPPDTRPMPPPAHSQPPARARCGCAGAGGVCGECVKWAPPRANRAGTQGFRPPEVLFKCANQTTAVDMWAAGVILASVLTGRYPFFKATDDMAALAEITSLVGSEAMEKTAQSMGCRLVTSTRRRGVCLRRLAALLRSAPAPRAPESPCAECSVRSVRCVCRDSGRPAQGYDAARTVAGFPDCAFDLCARLLEPDPRARITAREALTHPFVWPHGGGEPCSGSF